MRLVPLLCALLCGTDGLSAAAATTAAAAASDADHDHGHGHDHDPHPSPPSPPSPLWVPAELRGPLRGAPLRALARMDDWLDRHDFLVGAAIAAEGGRSLPRSLAEATQQHHQQQQQQQQQQHAFATGAAGGMDLHLALRLASAAYQLQAHRYDTLCRVARLQANLGGGAGAVGGGGGSGGGGGGGGSGSGGGGGGGGVSGGGGDPGLAAAAVASFEMAARLKVR